MTTTRDAWAHVGDRLSALMLKLKLHAEEELSTVDLDDPDGLTRVRRAISEAFDAVEDAYADEAVREDVREAGQAFLTAIDATSRQVQDRIRTKG